MPTHYNKNLSNLTAFEFINSFSIWVILGAPLNFLFFSELFNSGFHVYTAIILTLGVWIIYTLDHIIDGYKRKEYSLSLRYYLHYRYHRLLLWLVAIASLIAAAMSFALLPLKTRNVGFMLVAVLVVYFLLNRAYHYKKNRNLPFKEIGVAFVVTLCFAYIPWSYSNSAHSTQLIYLVAGFGCINLANLLMFSHFDFELDNRNGLNSLGSFLSKKGLRIGSILFALLAIGIYAYVFYIQLIPIETWLILTAMGVQTLLISFFTSIFNKHERYRFFGDLIYIYPIIYFLFL